MLSQTGAQHSSAVHMQTDPKSGEEEGGHLPGQVVASHRRRFLPGNSPCSENAHNQWQFWFCSGLLVGTRISNYHTVFVSGRCLNMVGIVIYGW